MPNDEDYKNSGPDLSEDSEYVAAEAEESPESRKIVDDVYADLLDKVTASDKIYDVEKIKQAFELARVQHKGQLRKSGEPYIIHPIAVASILLEFYMDADTICAALLHDVVEDTDIKLADIRHQFGREVATLVDGVTKIGKIPLNTEEENEAENIRKILIYMARDIRVIIIKLADRLHNMRTLQYKIPEKQIKTAKETMNFYAPIAHRLGMGKVKEEMEDLSLRYLDPFGYQDIVDRLNHQSDNRGDLIRRIEGKIGERLSTFHPLPLLEGRIKSLYGIYKKMYKDGKNFEEVYDVYAVRIIVQSVVECYSILGVIHDMFRPIPGRFKDYIANPKANRYQSLHTTVIGKDGVAFEVQIRTVEMHNNAQYGVAAHWKYKTGIAKNDTATSRFEWIHQILEQQQETDDAGMFTEALKYDLAPDEVYVFTPKGDIKPLPVGSTVIDFAYAIHTQVGHHMLDAKVSGRMVSFEYELRTGDIVEIRTTKSASAGPSRNWLNIAKTNEAKAKIRAWFKVEKREENIEEGRQLFMAELRHNSLTLDEKQVTDIAQRLKYDTSDDLMAAIAYGGITMAKVIPRAKEEFLRAQAAKTAGGDDFTNISAADLIAKKPTGGVIVDGMSGIEVHFAKCCAPLPGDPIVGFVTRVNGISVHRQDCSNAMDMSGNVARERWVNARWADEKNLGGLGRSFHATVDIISEDRIGLVADVAAVISGNRILIIELNSRNLKNSNAIVSVTLEVAGLDELSNVINKLKKIGGVLSVERAGTNN